MPYIDLAGLSRFASRQKDRLERDCALLRDMQWLRTEKAGAVSLWPVGGTPLKPAVDFLFTETPPASGDKGPENPSTITGVSSVKVVRTGTNLLALQPSLGSGYLHFEEKGEGKLRIYGTTQSSYDAITLFPASRVLGNMLLRGNTYTASYYGFDSNLSLQIYAKRPDNSYTHLAACSVSSNTKTFTVPENAVNVWIRVQTDAGKTVDDTVRVQIELGSTATAFEPYAGTDYTIDLGGTYYGGTLDVASGVMTVDWEYVSIDRFYNCYVNSNTIRFSYNTNFDTTGYVYGQDPVGACNRFDVVPGGDTEFARQTGNPREMFVAINKSRLDVSGAVDPSNPTNSEWLAAGNAWLAEHPVVFIAKRATPYTVQLDPVSISALVQTDKYTPRLNTVYTDASAVQVGYVKSPIREEFELQQAVAAQGGNV